MFEELADSLQLWTERLYRRLRHDQVEHVFFLSREGQPLKRMFDAYAALAGGGVQSHYLEVSRRATLLPSLKPLEAERFETLFRQYRAISLVEFLSSLGLEDSVKVLVENLALKHDEAEVRLEDFPNSRLWERVRSNAKFRALYDMRRVTQREVFIDYLQELAGGVLPETLVVVDVGWKGTIQDNLHAMLCTAPRPEVNCVKGFYVGLIADGSAGPTNTKDGLLFSHVGGGSLGFHVFNENKSLFEVVLAADHGSVIGYARDSNGRGQPVRGTFDEGEMLERSVFPVLRRVEQRFQRLIEAQPAGSALQLRTVMATHARMVFRPSASELEWFNSIFHVENFGVFERSYFAGSEQKPSQLERLGFLLRLLKQRNVGQLGFWPWATLYRRAGLFPAQGYGAIRQWQARRGVNE